MSEYQDHEEIRSSAKAGKGAGLLLAVAFAATIALYGWNMRWSSSSGPTSVTIVGINGPNGGSSNSVGEGERAEVLRAAAELADNR